MSDEKNTTEVVEIELMIERYERSDTVAARIEAAHDNGRLHDAAYRRLRTMNNETSRLERIFSARAFFEACADRLQSCANQEEKVELIREIFDAGRAVERNCPRDTWDDEVNDSDDDDADASDGDHLEATGRTAPPV